MGWRQGGWGQQRPEGRPRERGPRLGHAEWPMTKVWPEALYLGIDSYL